MPPARLALAARLMSLLTPLLAGAGAARADVGGTLSLQTDARERGVSYSRGRPAAQLGVAWDGGAGWYAGAFLAQARLDAGRHGTWLRAYGGRVVTLTAGLDGEAGLVAHRFTGLGRYDYREAYVGLLGDGWTLRLHHAPDHYGSGLRTDYLEFGARWPVTGAFAFTGHAGVLGSHGRLRWPVQGYAPNHGPTRIDVRAGLSWQLGPGAEAQLAWVCASRGGPAVWAEPSSRRKAVASVVMAF